MRSLSAGTLVLLLATASMLAPAPASAYRVDFVTADFGTVIVPGDLVTINVNLDTEGQSDIVLLAVGVLFEETVFAYRKDLSSTTSYLLYTDAKSPYLVAASTCGGGYGSPTAGDGCNTFLTRSNQVQLDFLSSALPSGVPGTTGTDLSVGGPQLVSLVFEAVAPGVGAFQFDFDPFYGSILQLGDTSNAPLTLGGGGVVCVCGPVVPEPSTALLVGLGLFGLGLSRPWSRR